MSILYTSREFDRKVLKADLCVVGGGMAGLCAALAAARNGLQVILVQDRAVLGGNASSEIRMWICGARGADSKEGGILEEILLDNYYYNSSMKYPAWDHVLYGKCREEKNLTLLLNTTVNDLEMNGACIRSVTAWNLIEQRWYNIEARYFADCSGDSVLRISGAEYRWGRESSAEFKESLAVEKEDARTMGNSILIQVREVDRHIPFVPPSWARNYKESDLPCRNLYPDGCNFWWLEIGGMLNTISDGEAIRDEALAIAYGVWALIKNHPDGRGHNWELEWIGSLPGKRENVRYVGDHIMTQDDIRSEGRFPDIVAHGGWSMDDHHPEAIEYPGPPTIHHKAPSPYGIPYRSLYSRNIDNLFFAGRNISTTHMALSSTRVMGTTSTLGQAVGTAAAIACRNNLTPRQVYEQKLTELQDTLRDQDQYIPWTTRTLPALLETANIAASTGDPAALVNGIERSLGGVDNGWWAACGDHVSWTWDQPQTIRRIRLICDSDFANTKRMPCSFPATRNDVEMPAMLLRDAELQVLQADGSWLTFHRIVDNRKRLVNIRLEATATTGVRLVIGKPWGGDRAHLFSFEVDAG